MRLSRTRAGIAVSAGLSALAIAILAILVIVPRIGTTAPPGSNLPGFDASDSADKAAQRELENALSRSTEGLVIERHPDGRESVHLKGRFQSVSLARIDHDGKLETTCVDDMADAEAFFAKDDVESPVPAVEVR